MGRFEKWRDRLRSLKKETYTLFLACRDERTPWYAKLTAAVVVAYAFSPIDLIPDFMRGSNPPTSRRPTTDPLNEGREENPLGLRS